ncbi:YegP family protein [Methylobacterium nodulans]|uniref:DUF1508 domain-containing protein n=1 Tax=Methylobacterium nodulans (strain LMG 21967 / CNCM I-2342 / ORS 2060) TaxID=460265 RepID=B8IUH6_METNO|nr:YegP family protein [Methylobacterium nodulans]ACL57044.1 hypothetical protein Mnod_2059 [Methylobacterium nodulans ORS 2060]
MSNSDDPLFEMFQTEAGGGIRTEWRWRLIDSDKTILAVSPQGWFRKEDCEQSIAAVKRAAAGPIQEEPDVARMDRLLDETIDEP